MPAYRVFVDGAPCQIFTIILAYMRLCHNACYISFCLQDAIAKLIRGNELELAISLSRIFPDVKELLQISTLLLVKRCEMLKHWYVYHQLIYFCIMELCACLRVSVLKKIYCFNSILYIQKS